MTCWLITEADRYVIFPYVLTEVTFVKKVTFLSYPGRIF